MIFFFFGPSDHDVDIACNVTVQTCLSLLVTARHSLELTFEYLLEELMQLPCNSN